MNENNNDNKKKFEVIIRTGNLPTTIEGLTEFILIGKELLNAHKAKIRAIEKVGIAKAAREAALSDTQDLAEILLEAEGKLGEILDKNLNHKGGRPKKNPSPKKGFFPDGTRLPDIGITWKHSHIAQKISKNPDVVEEVKVEAREKGKIATSQEVYKRIKEKEVLEERKKAAEKGRKVKLNLRWNVKITRGDFREEMEEIPDDSVDLIFTDPPYLEQYIHLYEDLARIAARKLKTGCSILVYLGHSYLKKVMDLMCKHLRHWWIICLNQRAGDHPRTKRIFVNWRPMLWFVKEKHRGKRMVDDMVISKGADKKYHEWQQSMEPAEYYIEYLSEPGELVVDPMCGSGTTCVAALKLGRKTIGIDIDPDSVAITKRRIHTEVIMKEQEEEEEEENGEEDYKKAKNAA